DLAARLVDVELAPEPPHGVLEGLRSAVGAERDRLAVEDDLVHGDAADALDHLRQRAGERLAPAAVDLDALARLVHLDAHAVELRLDRHLAEALAESARTLGRRPFAGKVGKASEGTDDVLEAERRLRGRCGGAPRSLDRRRPDTQALASRTPGEEPQRGRHRAGRHAAEEIGE